MSTSKNNAPSVVRPLRVLGRCNQCGADWLMGEGDRLTLHDRTYEDGVDQCSGSGKRGDVVGWFVRAETLREQAREMLLREHADAIAHGDTSRAELCSIAREAIGRELVWFALERAKRGILR